MLNLEKADTVPRRHKPARVASAKALPGGGFTFSDGVMRYTASRLGRGSLRLLMSSTTRQQDKSPQWIRKITGDRNTRSNVAGPLQIHIYSGGRKRIIHAILRIPPLTMLKMLENRKPYHIKYFPLPISVLGNSWSVLIENGKCHLVLSRAVFGLFLQFFLICPK